MGTSVFDKDGKRLVCIHTEWKEHSEGNDIYVFSDHELDKDEVRNIFNKTGCAENDWHAIMLTYFSTWYFVEYKDEVEIPLGKRFTN